MNGPLTLLLLPGTLCNGRVWAGQIDALRAVGPVVVAQYDGADTIGAMAQHALSSVEADARVVPIGLSMGGMVALEIWRTARPRVAAMALLATNPLPDTLARHASRNRQIQDAVGHGMPFVAQQLARAYCDSNAERPEEFVADIISMASSIGLDGFRAQSAALATRHDYRPLLGSINVPVLVMAGKHDRICGLHAQQQMAAAIPDATFEALSEAGHLIPLQVPDETNRLLLQWLVHIVQPHATLAATPSRLP
ncbi:alpha/beta hydrolase [Paraburkholderia sp.]|uniref:alpha/beta fold hydrolase n=1 Tax=Paraburkholderia sp. TaxID=1926495 RepID=UPI002D740F87|nr:alpha/beta hydrolase [Paraburkholderia sp.]HZZ02835.1 alpha/beta hydrolase [Paraburkholderia sp.]